MGITFDIHGTPPTVAEIAAAREQLLRDKIALERRDWKVFAGIMAVFVLSMAIALTGGRAILVDQNSPTMITAIVYGFPYAMIFVFGLSISFRHRKIEEPKKIMAMALAALENLAPEDLVTVAAWGQQDTIIARYQSSVAAQGRALVRGEMEMMEQLLPVADTVED